MLASRKLVTEVHRWFVRRTIEATSRVSHWLINVQCVEM
jgi:hypothetical protein